MTTALWWLAYLTAVVFAYVYGLGVLAQWLF